MVNQTLKLCITKVTQTQRKALVNLGLSVSKLRLFTAGISLSHKLCYFCARFLSDTVKCGWWFIMKSFDKTKQYIK